MKRMIRMAAENGFDKISWDTGKTNADRYGLRNELSRIVLSDNSSVVLVSLVWKAHFKVDF
jgi:hypothetical protein